MSYPSSLDLGLFVVVLFACCWPCGPTCACKLCAVCLVALSSSKLFLSLQVTI